MEAKGSSAETVDQEDSWTLGREAEKARTHGLFLAHVCTKSHRPGQKFEAYIFIVRHIRNSDAPQKVGFDDVSKVEFYFGEAWGHKVFSVKNLGDNALGVKTHAYGTFLAICKITFQNSASPPVVVNRYIDHEMSGGA